VAPEHLIHDKSGYLQTGASQKGDVYSFAIILEEVTLRSVPYDTQRGLLTVDGKSITSLLLERLENFKLELLERLLTVNGKSIASLLLERLLTVDGKSIFSLLLNLR
jgi:hypothetical protein